MTHRKNIQGTSPFEPVIGFSRAVRIGNQIHVSGTGPVGADEADVAEQTDQCLTLIAAALKNAGSSIEHVYRTRSISPTPKTGRQQAASTASSSVSSALPLPWWSWQPY